MKLEIEQAIVIRYVSYGLAIIFILVVILVFFSSGSGTNKNSIGNDKVSYDDRAQVQRGRLADDISSSRPMNEAYTDLNMSEEERNANRNTKAHVTANPPIIPENLKPVSNQTETDSSASVKSVQTYSLHSEQQNDTATEPVKKEAFKGYKNFKGSIYKFDYPRNAIILVMDDKSGLSAVNVTDNTRISVNDVQISFSDLRIGDKVTAEGYGLMTESNLLADTVTIHGFTSTAP